MSASNETDSMQVLASRLDASLEQQEKAREAMRHLYTVVLDRSFVSLKAHARASHGDEVDDWYDPEDENAPFFTEAYLYAMLGKEEARTVLAIVRRVGRALGMDERELH